MPDPLDLENRQASRVGLLLDDFRGISPELLCDEGDRVRAGDAVLRDRRHPQIRVVAPVGGRIAFIERGVRRKLLSLQIEVIADAGSARFDAPPGGDAAGLRAFMLETGCWSMLRTRPFGNIPRPEAEAAAIFVNALDNDPEAPDPRLLIDHHGDAFAAGVGALAALGEAPVYVCHARQHELPVTATNGIRCVAFGGEPAAGRPGVHINALCPIGFAGGEVWQLDYQQTIALGWLLLHGSPWLQRMISLGGSGIRNPRSLLVPPGAAIDELLDGELVDGSTRVIAGSAIHGRPLVPTRGFLGARQRQITVLAGSEPQAAAARAGVVIPGEQLERLAPPGILAVPLMRALQLGDAERARELGALELLEDDLAPLSRACVSGNDYGQLLRRVLDDLEAGR